MSSSDSIRVISHDVVMAALADLSRMIEQATTAHGEQRICTPCGRFGTSMIGPTVHHVDSRQTCSECRTRVFTYADELDDDGNIVRHLCRRSARCYM